MIAAFVAFGTLAIHSTVVKANNLEYVDLKLDDDPDKELETEAKTDGKDKKECKETNCKDANCKAECKDGTKQCKSQKKCCPSQKKECKKEGDGDKK